MSVWLNWMLESVTQGCFTTHHIALALFLSAAHVVQRSDWWVEIADGWPRAPHPGLPDSHTHLDRQGAHADGPTHRPTVICWEKWSTGSCVALETRVLTCACGPWVISGSPHRYIHKDVAFVSWRSPPGCALRLWKRIELIWVRLWDVSLANV